MVEFRSEAPAERILIVSNRLPITVRRVARVFRVHHSAGGLASALSAVHASGQSLWIGDPGDTGARGLGQLARQLDDERLVAVPVAGADRRVFYEHLSNGIIWPLFHDRLDQLPLVQTGWDVYERVNGQFADVVAKIWRPGDVIWIHDYHLMRLPLLLRQRIPEARIGFFLHIPFPNPELFLTLPPRKLIVEGLLGSDLVGFHTRRYRGHFTAAIRRLLHQEMDADEHVRHDNRAIRLGIFPIGVAARELSESAVDRNVTQRVLEFRARNERVLLGVDRLDYTEGIPRRLCAFELLLLQHPEYRGRVQLIQIAVPSRTGLKVYRHFRREVEALVTRINGRFASPTWTPIHYLNHPVERDVLLALYRSAEVMLVTPVRDGMNLVAKEFVAARNDENGVLILSEFAGASEELTEAVVVNPYDVQGVAGALHGALTMDRIERRRRMRALRMRVMERDVQAWAHDYLDALRSDPPVAYDVVPR